ncbi:histidine kinase [Sphingobacterium sp. UT-1RO-CII-1]|uniref:sensor histidine kinase n=1 Tax=Sphingobacterium sp. UT-1RO-CII-1 TaxID=2995225 RepID=UPI00227CA1F4|nr:histidine kinase [Sphingobacterium sp. UT-1RO-CII-1]MCY4779304.1 histidine kinase [Sphingobacterium sp. UT-1RO-CII-1]
MITGIHDISDHVKQVALQLHLFTGYATVSTYLLYIYPEYFSIQRMKKWIVWTIGLFAVQSLAHYTVSEIYPLPHNQIIPPLALSGMTLLGLLIYSAGKAALTSLYSHTRFSEDRLSAKIIREVLLSLGIGFFLFLIICQTSPYFATLTAWSIPFCYLVYVTHQYYLLSYLRLYNNSNIIRITLSILCNLVYIALFSSLMEMTLSLANASFNGFNIAFCAILGFVITFLTYLSFAKQNQQESQILGLEKKLGKTAADLKLLQSQINPHFLFNIMNTLYSIALIENAEKTASGIHKLSEMMRFMLHENQQENILLTREINYISEYIALQKLRIADLPSIMIQVELPEEIHDNLKIAPMLLIPFIENAFKHGISLKNRSWIRIQLQVYEQELKLSIYNSIHTRSNNDPESHNSGIGLNNVINRLLLLYPGQHKLHFEETTSEYFIFLTIKLE